MPIALIDIAIERGDDSGAPLDVKLEWLAEKFIELNWNHSKPFGGAILSQNKGANISVLGRIQALQAKTLSLAGAHRVSQWRTTVRDIGQIIQTMPLFRLQLLRGDQRIPFLYDEEMVSGAIRLKPGVAYVRVSSLDQNTERQLDRIDVDRTFTDKASGKDTHRPQLKAALEYARDGDTLLVHSMDRLARNAEDLLRIVRELTGRGVSVEFV